MLAGKVRALPSVETLKGALIKKAIARDKHSSLLRKLVNYNHKRDWLLDPACTIKSFTALIYYVM
jgi:hypothetical protein